MSPKCSSCIVGVLLLFGTVAFLGCQRGSGTIELTGKVILDGEPVEGAAVVFEPEEDGPAASATTDSSGDFRLETIVGMHKVAVSKTKTTSKRGAETDQGDYGDVSTEYLTPMKYASTLTSGLTIDVQPGEGPVTLDLSSSE